MNGKQLPGMRRRLTAGRRGPNSSRGRPRSGRERSSDLFLESQARRDECKRPRSKVEILKCPRQFRGCFGGRQNHRNDGTLAVHELAEKCLNLLVLPRTEATL